MRWLLSASFWRPVAMTAFGVAACHWLSVGAGLQFSIVLQLMTLFVAMEAANQVATSRLPEPSPAPAMDRPKAALRDAKNGPPPGPCPPPPPAPPNQRVRA